MKYPWASWHVAGCLFLLTRLELSPWLIYQQLLGQIKLG